MPIRIVYLIDDDAEVTDSIAFVLRGEGFDTFSFPSADQFLQELPSLASACVLADLRMRGVDGITFIEKMREVAPNVPIIIMTGHGDVTSAVRSMKAGAVDYLQKPFSKGDLMAALESAGLRFDRPLPSSEARMTAEAKVALLTKREWQVVACLAHGRANKSIAYDLGISARTVEVHRSNAMKKLGVHSLPELLHIAFLAGIMDTIGADSSKARPKDAMSIA